MSAEEKLVENKVPTRRVRMMMVRPQDFMFLFTKGLKWRKNTTLIDGVPADAQIVSVAPDSIRNGIMIVVQSMEYDEVPINVIPPVQPIELNMGVENATKKKKVARKK